ncbi:MAG: hypothetical protein MJ183_06105 [Treponemataceae bacterium]|nr:hypothetical protein [Treponemataceae bacterium]
MAVDCLKKAKILLRKKQYNKVISLLEPQAPFYRDSVLYLFYLGSAYFFVGDLGSAESYYRRARRISRNKPFVENAYAAVLLRRGEIPHAVETYLAVLSADPNNKTAKKAISCIQRNSDQKNPDSIQRWVKSDSVKKLYPKFGIHPSILPLCFLVPLLICGAYIGWHFYRQASGMNGVRADMSHLVLSVDEKSNPLDSAPQNLGSDFDLSSQDIVACYDNALKYFQQHRDNASQVEINRILNSNASATIKIKTRSIMDYLEKNPTYASFKENSFQDNFSLRQVQLNPRLYLECHVLWQGSIVNLNVYDDKIICEFLVGSFSGSSADKMYEGSVRLELDRSLNLDMNEPYLEVFGKLTEKDGKLYLTAKTIRQSINGEI